MAQQTRLNRKGELWSHLSSISAIRNATGTFGSTTLSAAAVVGAGTLTVTAITNFSIGETIAIGSGEEREIVRIHASTAPAASTITLDPATPLRYAHPIGDAVIEQAITDLGHIDADSVQVMYTGDPQDVSSEIQRQLFASATGYFDVEFEFKVLGFKPEAMAAALGILETRVLGAGTPADPTTLTFNLEQVREENDIAIRLVGVRKDGQTVRETFMGVELDPTVFDVQLARGQKASIPFKGLATAGVLHEAF